MSESPPFQRSVCAACRHVEVATVIGAPCPVCRGRMEVLGVRDGIVTAEQPCLACGYSLRGLAQDGECPECSVAVGKSLQDNLLGYSEIGVVERVALGMKMILIGMGLHFVCVVGFIVRAVIYGDEPAFLVIAGLVGLGAVGTSCRGWWLASTFDAAFVGRDRVWPRRVLRIVVVASAVALAVGLESFLFLAHGLVWSGTFYGEQTIFWSASFFVLVWPVRVAAALGYFRLLAMRIPEPNLAGIARNLERSMYGAFIVAVAMIVGGVLVVTRAVAELWSCVAQVLLAAGVGAGMVWFGAYIHLIKQMGVHLTRVVREMKEASRATAAAADVTSGRSGHVSS